MYSRLQLRLRYEQIYRMVNGKFRCYYVRFLCLYHKSVDDKEGQSHGIYYAILSFFPDCSPYIAVAVGTFVGAFGVDECKNFIRLRLKKLLGGDTSEEKDNKTDNE